MMTDSKKSCSSTRDLARPREFNRTESCCSCIVRLITSGKSLFASVSSPGTESFLLLRRRLEDGGVIIELDLDPIDEECGVLSLLRVDSCEPSPT